MNGYCEWLHDVPGLTTCVPAAGFPGFEFWQWLVLYAAFVIALGLMGRAR